MARTPDAARRIRRAALERRLETLERSLLLTAVRSSPRAGLLLADDFVEFGSSGRIFDQGQILAALRSAPPVKVTATDFEVRSLTPRLALVTYRAHRHSDPPVHTLRSSLWARRRGRWRMIFHQGTPTSESP